MTVLGIFATIYLLGFVITLAAGSLYGVIAAMDKVSVPLWKIVWVSVIWFITWIVVGWEIYKYKTRRTESK